MSDVRGGVRTRTRNGGGSVRNGRGGSQEPKRTQSRELPIDELIDLTLRIPANVELSTTDTILVRAKSLAAAHPESVRYVPLGRDPGGAEMFCLMVGHSRDLLGIAADPHGGSEPTAGTAVMDDLEALVNDPARLSDRTVAAFWVDRSQSKRFGDSAIRRRNQCPQLPPNQPSDYGARSVHPDDNWEFRFEDGNEDVRVQAIKNHMTSLRKAGYRLRLWIPGHTMAASDGLKPHLRFPLSKRRQSLAARNVELVASELHKRSQAYPRLSMLPSPDAPFLQRLLGTTTSLPLATLYRMRQNDPTYRLTCNSADWMLRRDNFPNAASMVLELPENVIRLDFAPKTKFAAEMVRQLRSARIYAITEWASQRAKGLSDDLQKDPYVRATTGWALADAWGTAWEYTLPDEAQGRINELAAVPWRTPEGFVTDEFNALYSSLLDDFAELQTRCDSGEMLAGPDVARYQVLYPFFAMRNTLAVTTFLLDGHCDEEGVELGWELDWLQNDVLQTILPDLRRVPAPQAVGEYVGCIEAAWQGIVHDRFCAPEQHMPLLPELAH